MAPDIKPQMAGLVSNWCTALLYGITVVLYVICMYALLKRRCHRNLSTTWILIGTSTAQFILATIHVVLSLRLLIEGFVHTQTVLKGAWFYFVDPATKSQVISRAIYVTNIVFASFVLIWRLYMVWGKNIYVCILPTITNCCSMVTGYIGVSRLPRIVGNYQPTSTFEILNWLLPTWGLSIATQVLATGLIAGKIWWHAKRNPVARSRYISVIAILIESGAIFTVSTAFLLAFSDLKTQEGAIIGALATQIATIAPTLIIIQVELMRNGDISSTRQVLVDRPIGHIENGPEEPTLQIMVSTSSISDSENEAKCSV